MKQEYQSDLNISYTKIGDYYFPNLALPPDVGDIGLWGRRRKEFQRKHRPILFNELLLTGELSDSNTASAYVNSCKEIAPPSSCVR